METRLSEQQRQRVEEFRSKHRTGVLTLLFTDMVASTGLKSELGDAAGTALIDQQQQVVRELLAEFPEAQEIKTTGDSFFIIFIRPSDAVRFSLLLHAKLREVSGATPHPIQVRIGIRLGEVFIQRSGDSSQAEDILGLQVDTASRVMGLGVGQQILMTRGVFDNARAVLRGEELKGVAALSWLAHGPYRLAGVEEPLTICEVGEEVIAPLAQPESSEKGQRLGTEDEVEGWRPALDVSVPGTSWILEKKLGQGGFGEVWLAHDKAVEKTKTVFKFCTRRRKIKSLRRELSVFNSLREKTGRTPPGIVEVRGAHDEEAPYFIELEYVAGGDLRQWIEREGNAAPLRIKLDLAIQMARSLGVVHAGGYVHRDVKPSNYLVEPAEDPTRAPTLRISDFGIGQTAFDDAIGEARSTMTALHSATLDQAAGTFAFIAPELLRSDSSPGRIAKRAETSADIYSLGVALYRLFAGDPEAIPGPRLRALRDPVLREDIEACLGEDPELRPSVDSLARRLGQHEERIEAIREKERREIQHRQRRGRMIIVAVSGSLVLALLFAGLSMLQSARATAAREDAEEQRERAEAARNRAVVARSDAESVLEFMVTDLHRALVPVGNLYVLEAVAQRAQRYYEQLPIEDETADSLRHRCAVLIAVGDILREQGSLELAESAYRDCLLIAARESGERAASADFTHYAARAHQRLGNVLRSQGRVTLALGELQTALDSLTAGGLSDEPPEWSSLRADVMTEIGNVHLSRGAMSRARTEFERALRIRSSLVDTLGGAEVLRDHSDSLLDISSTMRGDSSSLAKSLSLAREAVEIRSELLNQDPGNARNLRDLSVALQYLASVYNAAGQLQSALGHYQHSLEIRQQLFNRDPENTLWARDVAITLNWLGGVHRELGNRADALQAFSRSRQINRQLVELDPLNTEWASGLRVCSYNLGQMYRADGEFESALSEHETAVEMALRLVAIDPGSVRWERIRENAIATLSWTRVLWARELMEAGRSSEAENQLERAIEEVAILTTDGTLADVRSNPLDTYAHALLHLGRIEEARPIVNELIERGWDDVDFLDHCREHGLIGDSTGHAPVRR